MSTRSSKVFVDMQLQVYLKHIKICRATCIIDWMIMHIEVNQLSQECLYGALQGFCEEWIGKYQNNSVSGSVLAMILCWPWYNVISVFCISSRTGLPYLKLQNGKDSIDNNEPPNLDLHSVCLGLWFLACLDEVQEELLYYPRHQHWRRHWRWCQR